MGISTIAPPIEIFHPIFNDSISFVSDPDVQPTREDLDNVRTLMSLASGIYLSEEYRKKIKAQLSKALLKFLVNANADDDETEADDILKMTINTAQSMILALEWRQELGEGGCDSSTQAGLNMKHAWLELSVGYNCIHIDFISDYRIERARSQQVLLPNVLSCWRGTVVVHYGQRIHGQGYCATPD
jgi:hypothetical protein